MERISFKYKNIEEEGRLINETKENYNIKLKSGYNILIPKEKTKIIKKESIDLKKENIIKKEDSKTKKDLKILIIHTGGTIASKVDYTTGAVSSKFLPEELLNLFPEVKVLAEYTIAFIENIASDDMRFAHYNLIIKEISNYMNNNYDGIIITHGTDTLHYTSAALYYSLKNLNIPVILVGAQRSSDRPSSDAFLNLASAIKFIEYNKRENLNMNSVFISMHYDMSDKFISILHGENARKLHTSRRDAFKPINREIISLVDFYGNTIILKNREFTNLIPKGEFSYSLYREDLKIGILKIHPNLFPEEVAFYNNSNFDGLIIEGTGLGHAPISKNDKITEIHEKIFGELRNLASKIPVIMTSQTIYGRINMNVYSPGRRLREIGILGNLKDLTSESAFIKLAYLLSNNKDIRNF